MLRKALTAATAFVLKTLSNVTAYGSGGWFPLIREPFAGAWQRNREASADSVLAHAAVWSCVTLIASDIAKMRIRLVEQDANGIWTETQSAAFSPVLRKPNHYQTRIQFFEWWVTCKLLRGNAYVLKHRDERRVVVGMTLLDPSRVTVKVADSGQVFYALATDNLSGLEDEVIVPASEIIHDRINCLWHPLVGTSPIFACGVAATMGNSITRNSAQFFENNSQPSGLLLAPTPIDDATAEKLKNRWQQLFTGANYGKVAVLGNNLKFEPLRMSAVDSQVIEHLKWSDETVCRAFHVPPFKVAVGQLPTYNNGELLDSRYYSDCLQSHIEHLELCLDEGLGIGEGVRTEGRVLGVECDLDGLLRMDLATQIDALVKAAGGPILTPDEARGRFNAGPLPGGDTLYRQQQDFSLAALAERDSNKPFATPQAPPPALPAPSPDNEDETRSFFDLHTKALRAQLEMAA